MPCAASPSPIDRGEYVSLMGPSGSGKTTFFNMIGALDFPTEGAILLGGRDLKQLTQAQLAYLRCVNIGYIFQNYNLVEVLSAQRNVMLFMLILGLSDRDAREKSAALLEKVGLDHRMHHLPGELSGGQQQRVAIAPALILADEPTDNLDSKTSVAIVALLSGLSKERGVTRRLRHARPSDARCLRPRHLCATARSIASSRGRI